MNKLVQLLESYPKEEVLRLTFLDGAELEYCCFQGVDKSIYKDDSYVIGELQRSGKDCALVEFQVDEIVRVRSTKTNKISYERTSN
jgi:hypothetical protein